MKQHVLVFVAHYLPGCKSGGPVRSLSSIVESCGDELDFRLITSDRDAGDASPYPGIETQRWQRLGKGMVRYLDARCLGILATWRLMRAERFDTLYLNSLFCRRFSIVPLLLNRICFRRPVVLAPRGELAAGALSIRALKKRLFLGLFRLLGLPRSIIWQATNGEEARCIEAVMGQGLDIRIAHNLSFPRLSEPPFVAKSSIPRLVFLSRISEKKNLHGALDSLRRVSVPLRLDVYGAAARAEDLAYLHRCEQLAAGLPPHIQVRFLGHLPNGRVGVTLAGYDLFYLPTLGENFGHAILEALAAGVPVLLADTTPWTPLIRRGGGWVCELHDHAGFAACIEQLARMGIEHHHQMRLQALQHARNYLATNQAVEETRRLFAAASSHPTDTQGQSRP